MLTETPYGTRSVDVDVNKLFKVRADLLTAELDLIKEQPEELRGRAREVLVQDFLKPFLPDNLEITNGVVISADGQKSGELDIVIYDRSAYSLFKPFSNYLPQKARPIPAEVVYVVIEVERRLSEKRVQAIAEKLAHVCLTLICFGSSIAVRLTRVFHSISCCS